MIGIGKWEATVSTMMFKYTGVVEIRDNNGEYEFIYDLPEKYKNVGIKYYDIEEVGNDTLRGKGEVSLLPGKVIEIEATFKGDKMTGIVKVPIMNGMTLKLKNGRRVG